MTEIPVAKVDVNNGSFEELVAISGIGEGLAERIIAGRPYASLDDLARVQGISARSVARWEPLLSANDISDEVPPVIEAEVIEVTADLMEEAELPEEVVEIGMESEEVLEDVIESDDVAVDETEAVEAISFDETVDDAIPPVIEVVEDDLVPEAVPEEVDDSMTDEEKAAAEAARAAEKEKAEAKKKARKEKAGRPLGRGDTFLLGGAIGVLSVLLAVVLTLGVLAFVNGGLDYVSPWELSNTQRQVETLESRMEVLNQDIDGLTTRLDALETLGGRVTDLETETGKLAEDAARMQAEMDGLQESVAEINEQVSILKQQYTIVEQFLGGMQGLLNELLPENLLPDGE